MRGASSGGRSIVEDVEVGRAAAGLGDLVLCAGWGVGAPAAEVPRTGAAVLTAPWPLHWGEDPAQLLTPDAVYVGLADRDLPQVGEQAAELARALDRARQAGTAEPLADAPGIFLAAIQASAKQGGRSEFEERRRGPVGCPGGGRPPHDAGVGRAPGSRLPTSA